MAMATRTENTNGLIGLTGFFFNVFGEKTPDNGEDGFVYALNESRSMVAVFDGCGGPGGDRYEALKGKTGAYLASRAAAAAYLRWFEDLEPGRESDTGELKDLLRRCLKRCLDHGGENRGGQLPWGRLPTTAAAAICSVTRGGVDVQLQWAGDSRVYLLDSEGLAQLTEDDPGGVDAMQSLTADRVPDNVIRLGRDYTIHSARLSMGRPGLLFAATKGCFRHLTTPMEFEYLLLSTLQAAPNAESWERNLSESLEKLEKDDCCISGLALNTGSFDELKRQLAGRSSQVYRTYIRGLDACTEEEKLQLWEHYKDHYHRLLCRV